MEIKSNSNIFFEYYASGSYGIILKNLKDDNYVYKISLLVSNTHICENNFIEMIYLSYFKNKYSKLYANPENNFLPLQNESTEILIFIDFVNKYNLQNKLIKKIIRTINVDCDDIIVINKMKKYKYNLNNYIYENIEQIDFLNVIKNLLLGLHLIHLNGIAHGDLKSSNIITNDKEFRIIDFGGFKNNLNPEYECTCTFLYRSPEEYNHEFELSKETSQILNPINSDIWSIGLVIFELLYNYNPIYIYYKNIKNTHKNIFDNFIEKKFIFYIKNIQKLQLKIYHLI